MTQIVELLVNLIQFFSHWIYFFCPVKCKVAKTGERVVRFTNGKPTKEKGRGWLWGTCCQTLELQHSILNKSNIDEIEFPLSDGVPVSINAVYLYDIVGLGLFLTSSEDTAWIISEFAEAELKDVLTKTSYDDFISNQEKIELNIAEKLQTICDSLRLGVKIRSFRINNLICKSNSIQNALCIERIISALKNIPEELSERANFGAMVALATNAMPMNSIASTEWEENTEEEEETA